MKANSQDFRRQKERPVLFLEVGLRQTKALSGTISSHSQVATKLITEESILEEEKAELRLVPGALKGLLKQHFPKPGEVVVVIDSSVSSRFVHRVPVGTADSIQEHLRRAISKSENLNLGDHFWTVTPLSIPEVSEKEMTAAAFQERTAVVSVTRRKWIDELLVQLQSEGWTVKQVLFQQACVIRAFQLFGGSALENETVGLLHMSQGRYSLSLIQNGKWISHRDTSVRGTAQLQQDVKTYLAGTRSHFRLQARCLFVSVDGTGAEILAAELKEGGSYARTWNALRKITMEVEGEQREAILAEGAQFNSLIGAMLISSDLLQQNPENIERSVVEEMTEWADKHLSRPLKAAACLALLVGGYLWFLNSDAQRELTQLERMLAKQRKQVETYQAAAAGPEKRVAELERFRSSRKFWPGVVAQIRNLNVEGVSLSQVKISDTLIAPEKNPFEKSSDDHHWRNSGSMIVEAHNLGGIGALEDFMNAVKGSDYIKPLLHKKKPVRVLNNIDVVGAALPGSLFTLEYPFQDKAL